MSGISVLGACVCAMCACGGRIGHEWVFSPERVTAFRSWVSFQSWVLVRALGMQSAVTGASSILGAQACMWHEWVFSHERVRTMIDHEWVFSSWACVRARHAVHETGAKSILGAKGVHMEDGLVMSEFSVLNELRQFRSRVSFQSWVRRCAHCVHLGGAFWWCVDVMTRARCHWVLLQGAVRSK